MKKTKMLKKNYEFKNVLSKGKYYSGKNIEAFIKDNNKSFNFLGLAISVKTGKAVKRNKIKRLISENYNIGSKLPSIKEFSEQMDLSPNTIRKALNNLAKDGILRFTRGRYGGTYVIDMPEVEWYVSSGSNLGDLTIYRINSCISNTVNSVSKTSTNQYINSSSGSSGGYSGGSSGGGFSGGGGGGGGGSSW